ILDGIDIVGSSPELLVRVSDGRITLRPIAGTRPRGTTLEDDERLTADLLADEKERAEHVMLVDLGRNDVGRVAKYGTVKVTELMKVEKYSHVLHIVSQVEGELNDGMSAVDVFRATFPAGTMTGAPKIRAMQIIDELEPVSRFHPMSVSRSVERASSHPRNAPPACAACSSAKDSTSLPRGNPMQSHWSAAPRSSR